VNPERHRKIAIAARVAGVGLNEYVCAAIDAKLNERAAPVVENDVFYLQATADVCRTLTIYPTQAEAIQQSRLQLASVSSGQPFEWVQSGSAKQH
jgi:hypothetical protein